MTDNIGVYIHIPFCMSKCYYCDFVSYTNMDTYIEKYVEAVCKEIIDNAEILSCKNITTIYIGGGTPSYIEDKYILQILDTLKLFLKCGLKDIEITIEINPGTINYEKLKCYYDYGINRLSIGMQSTEDDILKNIGRKHSYNDILIMLENATKIGFKNISIDVIYPLPGLDVLRFKTSLNKLETLIKKYNIKHISIYNLEIHENTKLEFLLNEGFLSLVNEDEEYEMKNMLEEKLQSMEFIKYEISNYAIKGYYSKHNLNYWKQGEYLGFGVNASSYINATRYSNIKEINNYIDNVMGNKPIVLESIPLDNLNLMKEFVILNLRLKEGVNVKEFKNRFKVDIHEIFSKELQELLKLELLKLTENNNYILTKRGTEIANIVWERFI